MKSLLFLATLAGSSMLHAAILENCPSGTLLCGGTLTESTAGNLLNVRFHTTLSSTTPGTAMFSYDQAYVTDGIVRPGLMRLTLAIDGDYSLASSVGSETFAGFNCVGSGQFTTFCYFNSLQNVTLGQLLSLHMEATISRPSPLSIVGGGYNIIYLIANFFEDNGGTPGAPVNVSVAPEPATVALILPILAIAALRRQLQRRS